MIQDMAIVDPEFELDLPPETDHSFQPKGKEIHSIAAADGYFCYHSDIYASKATSVG